MRSTTTAFLTISLIALGFSGDAAPPPPCARLLTAAEVAAAAGPGFKDVGQEASKAGESECVWLLEGGANPKAIAFRFSQGTAAPAGLLALFETQATKAEKLHGNKREALDGFGARAALVPGKKPGAMAVLVVETPEGVAYVETDYLERPQILRLARAIVAP